MSTNYSLNVFTEENQYEIFINNQDKIFFGDTNKIGQAIVFGKEDWPEIKAFIDTLVNDINQNG